MPEDALCKPQVSIQAINGLGVDSEVDEVVAPLSLSLNGVRQTPRSPASEAENLGIYRIQISLHSLEKGIQRLLVQLRAYHQH
jgi:hypothetical protein